MIKRLNQCKKIPNKLFEEMEFKSTLFEGVSK